MTQFSCDKKNQQKNIKVQTNLDEVVVVKP